MKAAVQVARRAFGGEDLGAVSRAAVAAKNANTKGGRRLSSSVLSAVVGGGGAPSLGGAGTGRSVTVYGARDYELTVEDRQVSDAPLFAS